MDVDGSVLEFDLGVRKYFTESSTRFLPYLGGGPALLLVDLEGTIDDSERQADDDFALGLWLDAGCYLYITDQFNIGLDIRWSWAEAKMFGEEFNGGGWQIGTMAAYHW